MPVLRRLRQDDCKVKASMGYMRRSCLRKKRRGEKGKGREGKGREGKGREGREERKEK
jgi:hypothetical protein